MNNALDILRYDRRADQFIRLIKDQELELAKSYFESKVDRNTLFPMVKEYKQDDKTVFSTNVRKQDKDGVWWRMHHTKASTVKEGTFKDHLVTMRANLIFESYNFYLNGIVPFEHIMFQGEPACIKCYYQWLSEEDRMAAISQFISPADYVIRKYMK